MTYLQDMEVRAAFNIPSTAPQFDFCSNEIEAGYIQTNLGSLYVYPALIESGLRVMIYSGDTDSTVPTISSEAWIRRLGVRMIQDQTVWRDNGRVAGFY